MMPFHARLFGAVFALTLAAAAPALSQQLELKIMAPAATFRPSRNRALIS
jgi:putative tricarboxylic transport membrane protein